MAKWRIPVLMEVEEETLWEAMSEAERVLKLGQTARVRYRSRIPIDWCDPHLKAYQVVLSAPVGTDDTDDKKESGES